VSALEMSCGRLIAIARQRHLTLLTVESCTAGALVYALSRTPGAGDVLQGGLVVYSKAQKTASLGIPSEVIAKRTAVNSVIARAMATAGLARSHADVSLSITGVAGPEPDEDGKPVGGTPQAICENAMLAVLHLAARFIQ
jgi:nicotinamide-nucleotide amidase